MQENLLQEMSEEPTVYGAIEFALSKKKTWPARKLSKPKLPLKANSEQALKYANELKEWEEQEQEYLTQVSEINRHNIEIDTVLVDFIKSESQLSRVVPKEYQDKVYSVAYRRGHSDGFSEIYSNLCELVEIFE